MYKTSIDIKVTKSRSINKQDAKDVEKFEKYYDKHFSISSIKPHIVNYKS